MAKQLSPFEKEFAAARAKYKADKGTNPLDPKYNFEFKGKKYNVEYAEEKKARTGGKSSKSSKSSESSGSSDSSAPKPTGAPIRKRTLEDMQKEGKNSELAKQNEREREEDWSKAKEKMADVALTGAMLLPAGRIARGAYGLGKKAFGAAKAFGSARKAKTAGDVVKRSTALEGELLPREAARAAAPKRLSGPSPQKRLTGSDNNPPSSGGAGRRPPPPSSGGSDSTVRYQMRPTSSQGASRTSENSPFTPPPSDTPELAAAVKNMKQRNPISERGKARNARKKDLAAYERGDITQREYVRGEIEPFKRGGKVKKTEESKKMVKKEISFFKKKGAPKSMIKHEKKEAKGMMCGGDVKKYAAGGTVSRGDGLSRVKTRCKVC